MPPVRPMIAFTRSFLAVLLLAPLMTHGESAYLIPGYCCRSWQVDDGLPNNSVAALLQTSNGMLWLGTYGGFVYFDGLRFRTVPMEDAKTLVTEGVLQLRADQAGGLWGFSDRGRVFQLLAGSARLIFEDPRLTGRLETVEQDAAGCFWILRPEGDVFKLAAGKLIPFGTDWKAIALDQEGLPWMLSKEGQIHFPAGNEHALSASFTNSDCGALASDGAGVIYVARAGELWRWKLKRFERIGYGNDFDGITGLIPAREGSVWVRQGESFRLYRANGWAAPPVRTEIKWVQTSVIDTSGALWIGEMGKGVTILRQDGSSTRLQSPSDLASDRVAALACDREGNIWAAFYDGGLQQLVPRDFETMGRNQGLPEMAPTSISQDPDGVLWVAGHGAPLGRIVGGKFSAVPFEPGGETLARIVFCDREGRVWAGAFDGGLWLYSNGAMRRVNAEVAALKNTRALFEDASGALWIGADTGVFKLRNGELISIEGAPETRIYGFAQQKDGSIWAATDCGLLRIGTDDRAVEAINVRNGLPTNAVSMVYTDSDDALWIGAMGRGLCRWKNGRLAIVGSEQGLPDETPLEMWNDGAGSFWITSLHGIMRVNAADLRRCADGSIKRVEFILFGKDDGLTTAECMGRLQPAVCHIRDGEAWVPTSRDIVLFKPASVRINAVPPSVEIEAFKANDVHVPTTGAPVRIKPGVERLEIFFHGVSLTAPRKVRYRRRLEGLDSEWSEDGFDSHVSYAHLPPGSYKFQFAAANAHGVWSAPSPPLWFVVEPHFWQRTSFQVIAAGVVIAGGALLLQRFAARRLRLKLADAEQRYLLEKERARIARDIHDELGASLTRVGLLCQAGGAGSGDGKPERALTEILGAVRELTRSMDEVVWAINPQHDSVESLMTYLTRYAQRYLQTAGIRCRFDLPIESDQREISAGARHQLFMAFKECLNNVVKHAGAKEATIRIVLNAHALSVEVLDDGAGIDTRSGVSPQDRLSGGNGLNGMAKRLSEIGGRCEISRPEQGGTSVRLELPFQSALL